jgi:glycosyltransferase involved in cell wall biosynthesis
MKVLMLSGYDRSLTGFRLPLLRAMVQEGHEVHAAAPPEHPETASVLAQAQVAFHGTPIDRLSANPLTDVRAFLASSRLLRSLGADVIFSYNLKPIIWGSLAAQAARVPGVYSMIAGLGQNFGRSSGVKGRMVSCVAAALTRQALRANRKVFFQNEDDATFCVTRRLVRRDQVARVNGSGVELDAFPFVPVKSEPLRFLMIGRPLRSKGVLEFLEAARRIKPACPNVRFRMVIPRDAHYSNDFSAADFAAWAADGSVEILDFQPDVRPLLRDCSVFVLPSYYGEGTPRSSLEAMATGRPIITTDDTGCRETVDPAGSLDLGAGHRGPVRVGANGILVPARDASALTAAMRFFIDRPEVVPEMGLASRRFAESRFDVREVNRTILQTMQLLAPGAVARDARLSVA